MCKSCSRAVQHVQKKLSRAGLWALASRIACVTHLRGLLLRLHYSRQIENFPPLRGAPTHHHIFLINGSSSFLTINFALTLKTNLGQAITFTAYPIYNAHNLLWLSYR